MSLPQMIDANSTIEQITDYLDSLSTTSRLTQTRSLQKKHQVKLYELAVSSPALTLDYFAPNGTHLREVIHDGRNTLPAFTLFQKRFCRSTDGHHVFGYNHGSTTNWIGPGYFVAKATQGNPDWEQKGSVVIDYEELPTSDVVETWPKIVPNSRGLQRFVYYGMQDFMRRVSEHVSIGVAYKKGKNSGNYFVLCRQS